MLKLRLLFLTLFALGLLTGCHTYALADDIRLDLDFSPVELTGPSDDLHVPYVQGTKVDIWVLGTDSDDVSEFTLESDDPAVLSVDSVDTTAAIAHCTAHQAGTATIHALKSGSEVTSSEVTVAAPTRAVLQPSGPLFVKDPITVADGETLQVLNGGTATYLVQYFNGTQQLFGNGVLEATPSDGITATPETTFLFQVQEWLQISPSALGTQTVALSANGVPLQTLTVSSVDETAVASVSVEAEDPSGAKDGDFLTVLAQSFDAAKQPIFGVQYTWSLAGEEATGEGDLFDFPFASGQTNTITANFSGLSASTSIEAKPGTGTVTSSNDIGCTAAPLGGAPAGSWSAIGLAIAALAVARLRRRAR
jgi:hypothetical protein